MKYLILLWLFILSFGLSAQKSSINLMNGNILPVESYVLEGESIKYQMNEKGKLVQRELEKGRVFSVVDAKGKETVVYEQDSTTNGNYTVDEMRNFIYGERDARAGHSGGLPFVLGMTVCGVSAYLMEGSYFTVALPIGWGLLNMVTGATISEHAVRDKNLVKEESYRKGYKRVAKAKKVKTSIIGAVVGAGIGLTTYFVVNRES